MTFSREQLMEHAESLNAANREQDIRNTDCDIAIFLLEHCEITIPKENRFFVEVNCAGIQERIYWNRASYYGRRLSEGIWGDGQEAMAYSGSCDFSHTTAEWESVISLGIAGLRQRIDRYAEAAADDEKKQQFYRREAAVYDAALNFMKRAANQALACGKTEMAQSLMKLSENSPSNLFEAMQTCLVYYRLQQFFDGTYLRTLGRLDSLFYPFYVKEERETAQQLVWDFLQEIDRLKAPSNIPFALGGTDLAGKSLINPLSYLFLNTYKKAQTTNTKLHLLCSETTPEDILRNAFEGVRDGHNSIVFLSDGKVIEALEAMGEAPADAVNYHVVGCYECGGNGELTCSCNARVNLPKALELALNGGRDMLTGKLIGLETHGHFDTFEDLYAEFIRQLTHLCRCAMKLTDGFEAYNSHIHAAPILSGTYTSALEKGGDLYADCTAVYNNSSVNAIGLGTVTDSLAALRKLVFEDRRMTLTAFTEILRSNWEGCEPLRLLIKNKFPKYGTGDKKTDALAQRIVDDLYRTVSGKPNTKGGIYRLGLFSIDWRWALGEKTAASADGRKAGETLSQNTSASFGADREGATAHLLSAASLDAWKTPNGAIVDIDLHSSAVRGEKGIEALAAMLKTYFELGGFAVHYNILDTDTLKDAKQHPEKYPNLQVRLCGWNVLFSTLSEKEKDEFIARSEK